MDVYIIESVLRYLSEEDGSIVSDIVIYSPDLDIWFFEPWEDLRGELVWDTVNSPILYEDDNLVKIGKL